MIELLAETAPSDVMDIIKIIAQGGTLALLAAFLLYRDWQKDKRDEQRIAEREARQLADATAREERLDARIAGLEEFQRETLVALGNKAITINIESATAIARSTEAIDHNTEAFRSLMQKLGE